MDENSIRQVLERLVSHGILTKQDMKKNDFDEVMPQNMGITNFMSIHYPNIRTLQIYSFNKDLMFVLKARFFVLKEKVKERLNTQQNNIIYYRCVNPKCHEAKEQKKIEEAIGRNNINCNLCQQKLQEFQEETGLDTREQEKCIEILNNMEQELKDFENYRIPSKFFGLNKQAVDFFYGSTNAYENLGDVNFVIKAEDKRAMLPPALRDLPLDVNR